jgi:hypothetical protein
VAAEDRGGHLDCVGVGRCFGDVRLPGIGAGIGHGKRRGAPAVRAAGCATLNPGSKSTVYLTVSKAELGYHPYRVPADFLSDSPADASSASAWQHVMIEK